MRAYETFPSVPGNLNLLELFAQAVQCHLPANAIPVRLVVTRSDAQCYHLELGVFEYGAEVEHPIRSIFEFVRRPIENTAQFNAVLLVPTGIGAAIGGHAGDAGPASRLLATVCDNLITHPNVVNASDINEMTENTLYVEAGCLWGR
jgi:hypothetical protein